MIEPVLIKEDKRKWDIWKRTCLLHSKTRGYKRAIDEAKCQIEGMIEQAPTAYMSWSAGKDSTALVHLCVECGVSGRILSIKDDMDVVLRLYTTDFKGVLMVQKGAAFFCFISQW